MIAIEPPQRTNRMSLSLLVGLLAGLGFAFGAWGIEGIVLSGAHAMFPFLKFAAGAVLCGLVGLLAGFLSRRIVHIFANVLIWAAAAVAFNRIAVYISFAGMQTMLGWFDPTIQSLVNYPIDFGVSTRATLMLVIMIVAGGLGGLFVNSTVDEASASEGVQHWISLLIWTGAFIVVGYLFASLDTQPLRDAVVKVDRSIQFSIEHAGEDLPNEVKSQMGQFGLKTIEPFIGSPYRLIASEYDQMLAFIKVLVQFEDQTAICPVINEIMGTCTLLGS